MKTQKQIFDHIKSIIPATLWDRYNHLSFGEMAHEPELSEWADELERAEAEWFESD